MSVIIGKFGSPHGIKGWVKVISYANPIENILNYLPWKVYQAEEEILLEKVTGKVQGKNLIVSLAGCHDRDQAKTYTNLEIFIDRSQLPPSEENEFYWVDLIGLTVFNQAQEKLGVVDSLFATGSNDVLVVKDLSGREHYIPYLANVILDVDLNNKKMQVDWDLSPS